MYGYDGRISVYMAYIKIRLITKETPKPNEDSYGLLFS